MASSLDRLFKPRSVAVVGASNTPQKPGYNIVKSLQHFAGDVYPINPKADEICGIKAYAKMSDVGKPIDLALFVIPAPTVLAAAEDAISANVSGCMIVTSGFGETDDKQGAILQDKIADLFQKHDIRLLGPNTAGFVNPSIGLFATFVPGVETLRPGNVAIVSQSGAVNVMLAFLSHRCGLGLSLAVGLGNAVDTAHADVIEFLAEDDETDVILLYAEGIDRGRELYEVINKTVPKTPIVALLVGKADIGDFAQSHTGTLIGSYELKRAALEQAGAIVVDSSTEAIDAANALSKYRLPANSDPGIGIVTGQAGPGLIMADLLRNSGVRVPQLTASSVEKISTWLSPLTYIQNPVDTGRPAAHFADILRTVADDEHIDAVLTFALDEPDILDPVALFEGVRKDIDQPLLFGTVGLNSRLDAEQIALGEINIPAFLTPERAAQGTRCLALDAKSRSRLMQSKAQDRHSPVLQDLELDTTPLNEAQAKAIIQQLGFAVPEHRICTSQDEAYQALQALGAPVVVKILDATIQHKTEIGGVHVNIENAQQLSDALNSIDVVPVTGARHYLVEKMAEPGIELIIGGKNDLSFGPLILVGMGGILAEAVKDTVVRIAPVTPIEAEAMLKQLRCHEVLDGWRGAAAVDTSALINGIVALSHLLHQYPTISELDLNPVRAYPDGVWVLDASITFT